MFNLIFWIFLCMPFFMILVFPLVVGIEKFKNSFLVIFNILNVLNLDLLEIFIFLLILSFYFFLLLLFLINFVLLIISLFILIFFNRFFLILFVFHIKRIFLTFWFHFLIYPFLKINRFYLFILKKYFFNFKKYFNYYKKNMNFFIYIW